MREPNGKPCPVFNYNPKVAAAMGFSEEEEEEEEAKDGADTSGQKLPCMKPEHDLFMLAEMRKRMRMMPATA